MNVIFKGRTYQTLEPSKASKMVLATALRRGVLDHLGSCQWESQFPSNCPQMYRHGDSLVVGFVPQNSQWLEGRIAIPI